METWKLLTEPQKLFLIAKLESDAKVKQAAKREMDKSNYRSSFALSDMLSAEIQEINNQLKQLKGE